MNYSETPELRPTLESLLADIYLDWFNNYLSTQGFAEDYGLSVETAQTLIEEGRKLHNLRTS